MIKETAEDRVNEERICREFVEPYFHCKAVKLPQFGIDRCLIRDSLLNPEIIGFAEVKATTYRHGEVDLRPQRKAQYDRLLELSNATRCPGYVIVGWHDGKIYSVFDVTKAPSYPPVFDAYDPTGETLRIPLDWYRTYTMHEGVAVPHIRRGSV